MPRLARRVKSSDPAGDHFRRARYGCVHRRLPPRRAERQTLNEKLHAHNTKSPFVTCTRPMVPVPEAFGALRGVQAAGSRESPPLLPRDGQKPLSNQKKS